MMAKMVAMSEQRADYDTNTNNRQPRFEPWEVMRYDDRITVDMAGWDAEIASMTDVGEKTMANARLIAAAGTAASELPDEYDPVAALKELPRLLDALQTIARADGTRYAGTDALQHVAEKALDVIRI